MEKSCDRLSPFVCWLGGLGCVPGEFTYFCRIEKYLIAGTAFLRAPLLADLPGSAIRFLIALFLHFGDFFSFRDTAVAGCHGRSKLPLH